MVVCWLSGIPVVGLTGTLTTGNSHVVPGKNSEKTKFKKCMYDWFHAADDDYNTYALPSL